MTRTPRPARAARRTVSRAVLIAALLLPGLFFAWPIPSRAADPGTEAAHGKPLKPKKRAVLTFPDGKAIDAYVVDTPLDRERGLMYYKKLPREFGELFVFPREMMMTFWMKNTLVPLDIVFIGSDKKITVVHADMKASTTQTPDDDVARAGGTALYVLELPAGAAKRHQLAAGDALKFDAELPQR